MLDYENQMLLDITFEDGLLISAEGLGVDAVFLNLIEIYCEPGNLVLVMGTKRQEEDYIVSSMKEKGISFLPRIVCSESMAERERMYSEGGVLFLSPTTIVMDILKKRLPPSCIAGIIVYHAHMTRESCQDSFALRLYRLENKDGFIKAFSSFPEYFTREFHKLDQVMKALFLQNLHLWPSSHPVVRSSLSEYKANVIELHLEFTPNMLEIQKALLHALSMVLEGIKRLNPKFDQCEITVENAMRKSFHEELKIKLDPIWHRLGFATKQFIDELGSLRRALSLLIETDCVRFYHFISSFRTKEYADKSSGWNMSDSVSPLFEASKRRLYDEKRNIRPEPNPKWETLEEILKEIRRECENQSVLILTNSPAAGADLRDLFTKGSKPLLSSLYNRLVKSDPKLFPQPQRKVDGESCENVTAVSAEESGKGDEEDDEFREIFGDSGNEENSSSDGSFSLAAGFETNEGMGADVVHSYENDFPADFCASFARCADEFGGDATFCQVTEKTESEPLLIVQTIKKRDAFFVNDTLLKYKPRYIILYDADAATMRRIEIFQNNHPQVRLTVYFLIYSGTVEELEYKAALIAERKAFEYLAEEKTLLLEKTALSGEGLEEDASNRAAFNSLVIVDTREFRSELPVLIHARGMNIKPVTLTVGDYILAADLCVERKSVDDLIGSLFSGRLYKQVAAMNRRYANPVLLIEFNQAKSFNLDGRYYWNGNVPTEVVMQKLQVLTMKFPKLRILWSQSPYFTAELFQYLKEGKAEPNVDKPQLADLTLGDDSGEQGDDIKFSSVMKDFLRQLPGLDSQNVALIMNGVKCIDDLLGLSKENLEDILGAENGDLLHESLHKNYKSGPNVRIIAAIAKDKRVKSRFRAVNKLKGKKKK